VASSKVPNGDLLAALDELLRSYNIYTTIADLGPAVYGFVYECSQGHRHIVLADWLEPAARRRIFWHEMRHIIRDFPRFPYMVGLDEQWSERERMERH
jgi:hypothetical protein